MNHELYLGDCATVMAQFEDRCVDALVTDPPSGIGFMGKSWDSDKGGWQEWIDWLANVMREALRLLKPGAYGLVWALPRTSHWTGSALQAAGFEVRDRVTHIFGTGFPKSKNDIGAGLGTALKPAIEDWWLVRRPIEGTYEENFRKWGTGLLNIDECRLGRDESESPDPRSNDRAMGVTNFKMPAGTRGGGGGGGRWPAHLVLDTFGASELDAQTADLKGGGSIGAHTAAAAAARNNALTFGDHTAPRGEWQSYDDEGGASRFFFRYVAKPSRAEREFGCEGLPLKSAGEVTDREDGSAGLNSPRAGAGRTGGARNHHPTLKPVALMRYLCRLITPKGGIILDPFVGSGTTGIAALREGYKFVGIEKELEYLTIAYARISAAAQEGVRDEAPQPECEETLVEAGQRT